jgi:hypothetical protein
VKRRPSSLGIAVRLVIVTVVAAVVSFHSIPQARAQDSDSPQGIEIDGTGAYEIDALMNAWGTPMFGSSEPVNLSYISSGDEGGRTQLALGQVDFAISGMPLSDQDNQNLASRNVGVIQAPLAMASAAFVYEAPQVSGLQLFTPTDPADPESDGTFSIYSNDLHLSAGVLARTLSGEESYNTYTDPEFQTDLALPAGVQFLNPGNAQRVLARSDAGAADYYIEQYIRQFALDDYNLHLTEQVLPANVQSENWPFLDMASRAGPKPAGDLLAGGGDPNGGNNSGGVFAVLDPFTAQTIIATQSAKLSAAALVPGAPTRLSVLALQNSAGDWVTPTPASITAAGALGGGAPLFGLNQAASGVYPFTWVDNLIVPSTGLSIDKTNAIATFLRYATGPGQDLAAGVDNGVLPTPLRTQAAQKADEIIKGNCAAAGGKTKTDPTGGPNWPTGVPAPSGGALICVAPAVAPTTTVAASGGSPAGATPSSASSPASGFGPTSFNAAGSGGSSNSSGSSAVSDDSETAAGSSTKAVTSDGAGDSEGGGAAAATTVRVDLPLKPPDDGQFALDRFATILLGGVAFVVLRSLVRPKLVGRL